MIGSLVSSVITGRVGTDVPVDPGAAEAQRLLLRELSQQQYKASQPTWFDRVATSIRDFLASLTAPTGGPFGGLGLPILLTLVVVALVVLFLVFGLPRLNRRSRVTGALFGKDDERTAREMLATARKAAADGDFATAIAEGFRSIARSLAERDLVAVSPGTTAQGFSAGAGDVFPALAGDIRTAAVSFDAVRYLDGTGSQGEWLAVEKLAGALADARPLREPQPA